MAADRIRQETRRVYNSLELRGLCDKDSEWVNVLWDSNLCQIEESLQGNGELVQLLERLLQSPFQLKEVVSVTKDWISNAASNSSVFNDECEDDDTTIVRSLTGFWTLLYDIGMNYQSLLALIVSLLEKDKSSMVERLTSVYCAQLYFTLLQIPGSVAYKVFHPILFQKSLDVLKLLQQKTIHGSSIGGIGSKRRRSTSSRRPSVSSKGSKRIRSIRSESTQSMEDDDDDDQTPSDNYDHLIELRSGLRQLLVDLSSLLGTFSLKDHDSTRELLITSLLSLSLHVVDMSHKGMELNLVDPAQSPTHCLVWLCLSVLCTSSRGSIDNVLLEVFRHLIPPVSMVIDEGGACPTPIPLPLIVRSQHAVMFISHIVKECGSDSIFPLKKLLQHVCVGAPDKAEYRGKLVGVVYMLMNLLDTETYVNFVQWLYKLSKNIKVAYRVLALDVSSELLMKPLPSPLPVIPCVSSGQEDQVPSIDVYQFIIKMIIPRCSDRSPSVRAKALSCLTVASSCHDNKELLTIVRGAIFGSSSYPSLGTHEGDVVMSMIKRRCSDDKVAVRKAAVQTITNLAKLRESGIQEQDVLVVHERCMDLSVSVRKQSIVSLTSLALMNKDTQHKRLHSLWLDGIVPMVLDREASVKEKCLEILETVVLNELSKGDSHFVWRLLSLLTDEEEDRHDLRRCLHFIIENWCLTNKLNIHVLQEIQKQSERDQYKQISWILLSEVSAFSSSIGTEFLLNSWNKYRTLAMATGHTHLFISLLKMLGHSVRRQELGHAFMKDLSSHCLSLLSSFKCPFLVIATIINTLTLIALSITGNNPNKYKDQLVEWLYPVLHTCEEYVKNVLSPQDWAMSCVPEQASCDTAGINEEELKPYLFTLGELGQLIPYKLSSSTGSLIQSLLVSNMESPSPPQLSHSFLSHLSNLTPSLQAHAYITLGKLCLNDEELSKTSLLLMANDLEYSIHDSVRSNIILVMSDLAIRYSAKVDPYISYMTVCLRDQSSLVRKQTLTLLIHLLQENYIKLKGLVYYHFLYTLTDNDLKSLTVYSLVYIIHARMPNIFYNNFIETIFHFNNYTKHEVYNQLNQSEREKELFSLSGTDKCNLRSQIYHFLLSYMSDEQKFHLTAKLCQEVLGGVVERKIPIDTDSSDVIKDTLAILASQKIKHSSLSHSSLDEAQDERELLEVAAVAAQTKIISQIVKRNMIENVIPIIVATKRLFEQIQSPLQQDLLYCLREIMKDYKTEMKDVLSGDAQLASEIEFDLRQFEEEMKRKQQQANTVATPLGQLASPLLSSSAHPLITPLSKHKGITGRDSTDRLLRSPQLKRTPRKNIEPMSHRRPLNIGMTTPARPLTSTLLVSQKAPPPAPPTVPVTMPTAPPTLPTTIPTAPPTLPMTTPTVHPTLPTTPTSLTNTLLKTPRKNLAKMALSAKKQNHGYQDTSAIDTTCATDIVTDERIASTPHVGLSECVSFNAAVPPSPIPANTNIRSYVRTQSREVPASNRCIADIIMRAPEEGPEQLAPWDIT